MSLALQTLEGQIRGVVVVLLKYTQTRIECVKLHTLYINVIAFFFLSNLVVIFSVLYTLI